MDGLDVAQVFEPGLGFHPAQEVRTARRYASRVLRFLICAAKNSRKRFRAFAPARTTSEDIAAAPPG